MLTACAPAPPTVAVPRPPTPGFCDLDDAELARYLVAIDAAGWASGSGVATVLGGRVVVLTNRHNLPPRPDLARVGLRNHRHAVTFATTILAAGRDFAAAGADEPARDFVVLAVRDPTLFAPLPLRDRRYRGPVVVPSFAGRRYGVARGTQWAGDARFDRLDLALEEGASGAPVISCAGEIAGLYTARVAAGDPGRAGFAGLATPATRIPR